ncbi:Alpha/Beta hydrolase protein [Choanephora cucurbitarum]|nr:Alpha/Beta hydrolase protein [Choanephora cucurbitarum]
MIREAEDRFSYQFPDGLNPDVECIRLNLDPVNAVHRPLLAYVGIYLITQCFNLVGLQWCWGFTPSHSTTHSWGGPIQLLDHLYQSLFNLASHQPKDKITYWYRAPTDGQRKTPIVFVHGIGIGVLSYAEWISLLLSRLSDRPIFLVELPYVAMRMVDTVPTATETTKEVRQMLNQYGYDKAVYVSHSLGTAVTSWIIKLAPDTVAGTVMIDPICFLLHYHHVAFNFVHRLPKQLIEYLMYYGASREMYISYYISRHFQWFESICFVEHIQKTTLNNMAVFLSEKDRIVGSEDVYHYLLEHGINTYVMKGLEHAMFLINRKWKNTIIHQIETISSKTD